MTSASFACCLNCSISGKYRRMGGIVETVVADARIARNAMPFEITTTRAFAAAHQLRLPGGGIEPLHGHNWRVKVTVSAATLDALGTVMDFHELERLLDVVLAPMHNR